MRLLLAFLVSMVSLLPFGAHAELRVQVTKGQVEPMPIAISYFAGQDTMGHQMQDVISNDLKNSGLFRPLDPDSFVQDAASAAAGPRFAEWKPLNSQALVTGTISPAGGGKLRVEFRLWDVFAENQIDGMAYTTTEANWRRIAHIIADVIYTRLTGEGAYFDSRIVYVAESGPFNARVKRLAIMDQDGYNHRYLTDGNNLVLTPRFSPDRQEITYMAYVGGKPRVYMYDIDSGAQHVVGDFPGMTFAPRFAPDGNSLVMSLAQRGNTDIYVTDRNGRSQRRLTNAPSIETAPSFSPDSKRIAFESDRSGTQQIYIMDSNGGNVQRISFGQGRYANPVWSPRGDLIAFTRLYQGKFYVGVMKPDGSGERMIVSAYHVEGPSWSPNGRYLTYYKESSSASGKSSHAYVIDLTGYNERSLKTPGDASDPAWSPLND